MADAPTEVLRGTLDLLILRAASWRPAHGYAIARWIEQATDDVLRIEEGSLYPALHRLEARGWIEAEWGASENNRRAKYYALTPKGRAQLRVETATWTRFANGVRRARGAAHAGVNGRDRMTPSRRPPAWRRYLRFWGAN